MSLEARADRNLIPAQGQSRRHVLLEITAPEAPRGRERPASNLALVLDRSVPADRWPQASART